MTDKDAVSFVELLYSVYGDTYTYKDLYEQKNYVQILGKKNTSCYGFFNKKNELIGHTALKYNENDYSYYSFLSMKKWIKSYPNRSFEKKHWEIIRKSLSQKAFFLYQNTTTSHLLAQKYSSIYLYSNPIGFIFNYTQNELYKSIKTNNNVIHCLTQVTILNKLENKKVNIFDNEWTSWIKLCYSGLGYEIETSEDLDSINQEAITKKTYEDNELGLIEYTISGNHQEVVLPKQNQNILVKIPINNLHLYNKLEKLNFKPVGIRLNSYTNDELILQQLEDREIETIFKEIKSISLYSLKAKEMLRLWINLVLTKKEVLLK